MQKLNSNNWKKIGYVLVVVSYSTICTITNTKPFMDFVEHRYLFALTLAFLISLVEMRVAQYVGQSIVLKHWKTAIIAFLIGFTLVIFLISRQQHIGQGIVISILFLIGILLSYGHAFTKEKYRIPNLIKKLLSQLLTLNSLETTLPKEIELAQNNLRLMAEKQIDSKVKRLNETISSAVLQAEQLTKEREAELAMLNIHQKDTIAEISRIYKNK